MLYICQSIAFKSCWDAPWGVKTFWKIEALCSFLQGENVRNFQSLQILRRLGAKQSYSNSRRGHSGFTRCCVELLKNHLCYSGNSDDPHLEDVDIQFHASCV